MPAFYVNWKQMLPIGKNCFNQLWSQITQD